MKKKQSVGLFSQTLKPSIKAKIHQPRTRTMIPSVIVIHQCENDDNDYTSDTSIESLDVEDCQPQSRQSQSSRARWKGGSEVSNSATLPSPPQRSPSMKRRRRRNLSGQRFRPNTKSLPPRLPPRRSPSIDIDEEEPESLSIPKIPTSAPRCNASAA